MSTFSDMVRQQARDRRQSEDFARFSDAQIDAWQPSYDPASGLFRSEGGGGALVEKPTECPHGTTLHGSTCIPWEQANAMFGGGYGPGAGPQVAPGQAMTQALMPWQAPQMPQVPLEQQIIEANRAAVPGFRAGEAAPGTGAAGLGLPQVMGQYQAPMQSATGGLMQAMAAKPAAQGIAPQAMGTGWGVGQDGLTQMMARRQKGGQQGWWV